MKNKLITDQPEVGKLIHELRLLIGLTQEQFGAAIGVTYSTVNRWERGRSKPSPLAVKLIEQMLVDLGDRGHELLSKYLAN